MKLRLVFAVIMFLGIGLVASGLAFAAPPRPSSFYGTVRVNGANAPTYVAVEAQIGGVTYATTLVQTAGADTVYAFDVPGDVAEVAGKQGGSEGETIQFRVGGLLCAQTAIWHEGTQVNLNLTATGTLPTLTPTNTGVPTNTPTLTRTPTVTPAVTATPVVVNINANRDTFIDLSSATTNYGSDQSLKARTITGINMRPLVAFDLTSIPTNATITRATLNLYCWYADSRYPHISPIITAYKVKQPWAEMQATWNQRLTGVSWSVAGCDSSADRDTTASGVSTVNAINTWYQWDITSLAQDWVTNPAGNQGLLLISDQNREVRFWSANYPSNRPYLNISYTTSGPAPTTSVTAAPSGTPTTGPTPTPITIQGASQDTYLNSAAPTTNYENTGLRIQGQGFKRTLMNFDVSVIPAGAEVVSATLRLTASEYDDGKTNLSLDVGAYLLNRSWVANQATWQLASTGVSWGVAGGDNVPADRAASPASTTTVQRISGTRPSELVTYDWDVTSIVQAWVSNPAGQAGLMLLAQTVNYRDVGFYDSAYGADANRRPKLIVQWRMSIPTPTPTSTATLLLSPTPTTTGAVGTVTGTVYQDANRNGVRDGGELGMMGAVVQLMQGATVLDQMITAGAGAYNFNAAAGSYFVKVVPPGGYSLSTRNPQSVTVSAGQLYELNFGVYQGRLLHLPIIIK